MNIQAPRRLLKRKAGSGPDFAAGSCNIGLYLLFCSVGRPTMPAFISQIGLKIKAFRDY
jgi:hypothetical protein